jgi:hypothetical protein
MNKSLFDPTRKTAGAIYRDAQIYGEKGVIIGDMNYELRKSLVQDLNDTVITGMQDFGGRPFYITVYEKKELHMKQAIVRRMIKTLYRPYPEDDTLVFRVNPYTNDVFFCWDLPHRREMLNELNNPDLYDAEKLIKYRHWENMRLEHFGFRKNDEGNWKENPSYKGDSLITAHKDRETKVSFANLA